MFSACHSEETALEDYGALSNPNDNHHGYDNSESTAGTSMSTSIPHEVPPGEQASEEQELATEEEIEEVEEETTSEALCQDNGPTELFLSALPSSNSCHCPDPSVPGFPKASITVHVVESA